MSAWRVVLTDSESLTGVAPACPQEHVGSTQSWVFDCCPGPHIECWSEGIAAEVARLLTTADADLCS